MSSTDTNSDRVFVYFPKLPLELRTMIWKYTLPGPRVIKVAASDAAYPTTHGLELLGPVWEASIEQSPIATPLLHACHDSRAIALKTYEAAFTPQLRGNSFYFDWQLDTLYFQTGRAVDCFFYNLRGSPQTYQRFPECDLTWRKQLRKMAVDYSSNRTVFADVYRDMNQLEKLEFEVLPEIFNSGIYSNSLQERFFDGIWRRQIETGSRQQNPYVNFVQLGERETRYQQHKQ